MQIPSQLTSFLLLDRPQVHSRKHHHVYNGCGGLPLDTYVRSPTFASLDDPTDPAHCDINHLLVYEVVLCFGNNRACTIQRSRADFELLRKTIHPWKTGPPTAIPRDSSDVVVLHHFLCEALHHRPQDCALEFFLRRRMDDCGGHRC